MKRFIVVSGVMASGKTRLANELAERLALPMVAKDGIKELLFDTLGTADREWSKKLGGATFALLFHVVRELLRGSQPFIVEGNFRPPAVQDFLTAAGVEDVNVLQVICGGDGAVLFQRFQDRVARGERHPGHVDGGNVEEFRDEILGGWYEPLALPGETIRVDTTDFAQVQYDDIAEEVRQWLATT